MEWLVIAIILIVPVVLVAMVGRWFGSFVAYLLTGILTLLVLIGPWFQLFNGWVAVCPGWITEEHILARMRLQFCNLISVFSAVYLVGGIVSTMLMFFAAGEAGSRKPRQ